MDSGLRAKRAVINPEQKIGMAEDEDDRPPGEEAEPDSPNVLDAPIAVGAADPVNETASASKVDDSKGTVNAVSPNDTKTDGTDLKVEAVEPEVTQSADPALTSTETAGAAAPVDPYAGYTGYDPAAAGYDYSSYWAQYGYHASGYSYPGVIFQSPTLSFPCLAHKIACKQLPALERTADLAR